MPTKEWPADERGFGGLARLRKKLLVRISENPFNPRLSACYFFFLWVGHGQVV
jgi:hypothetical protein